MPDRPPLPTCRCGYDRTHPAVRATAHHGIAAWIVLFSGATAYPKRVTFRCARCGETVEECRDPEVLRSYR
ncbi:MAG: hypothetical protein R3362_07060 [Rhodothermales bacterium]|nr:hypothetical protein [Rhodothermales bacterium]